MQAENALYKKRRMANAVGLTLSMTAMVLGLVVQVVAQAPLLPAREVAAALPVHLAQLLEPVPLVRVLVLVESLAFL